MTFKFKNFYFVDASSANAPLNSFHLTESLQLSCSLRFFIAEIIGYNCMEQCQPCSLQRTLTWMFVPFSLGTTFYPRGTCWDSSSRLSLSLESHHRGILMLIYSFTRRFSLLDDFSVSTVSEQFPVVLDGKMDGLIWGANPVLHRIHIRRVPLKIVFEPSLILFQYYLTVYISWSALLLKFKTKII